MSLMNSENIGVPLVYEGREPVYFDPSPLYSAPYTFCKSDDDCKVNAGAKRCLSISPESQECLHGMPYGSCICTNAVVAARFQRDRRTQVEQQQHRVRFARAMRPKAP